MYVPFKYMQNKKTVVDDLSLGRYVLLQDDTYVELEVCMSEIH